MSPQESEDKKKTTLIKLFKIQPNGAKSGWYEDGYICRAADHCGGRNVTGTSAYEIKQSLQILSARPIFEEDIRALARANLCSTCSRPRLYNALGDAWMQLAKQHSLLGENLEKKLAKLKSNVAAERRLVNTFSGLYDHEVRRGKELQETLEVSRVQGEGLRKRMSGLEAKIRTLKTERNDIRDAAALLEQNYQDWEHVNAAATADLEERNAELRTTNITIQNQLDRTVKELNHVESQYQELVKLRVSNAKMKEENEQLLRQVARLETEKVESQAPTKIAICRDDEHLLVLKRQGVELEKLRTLCEKYKQERMGMNVCMLKTFWALWGARKTEKTSLSRINLLVDHYKNFL